MSLVSTLDLRTVPGTVAGCEADHAPASAPGWADSEPGAAHTLPEGTRLLDYEIVGPIGEGGFGIVYLAWDHAAEEHVAIKEYLPVILASRASVSPAVVVRSQRHSGNFRNGMRSFVNEARMLARFDHPALVKVLNFWEGNGTAYMAMPYYAGPTLARALTDLGRPPTEAELLDWLRPLLDALGIMHAASCFHRDIAPDNILLTDSGPVLLDFGAARRVIDGAGPSPTVVLKPGFAPIEQYGEVASMKQGAWTDLYALAGVVYAAIAGKPPTPSIERLMDDRLPPLFELAHGNYSPRFLAAIDTTLSVHPGNRPQSAAEFWSQLNDETDEAPPEAVAPERPQPPAVGAIELDALQRDVRDLDLPRITPPAPRLGRRTKFSVLATAVFLIGLVTAAYNRVGDPVLTTPPLPPTAASPLTPVAPVPEPVAALPYQASRDIAQPAKPSPAPRRLFSPEELTMLPEPETTPDPAPVEAAEPVAPIAPVATVEPTPKPVARASVEPARPATRREARNPASEAPMRSAAVRVPPAETAQAPDKCTEILQRASLEPLTPGEAALLRKGCE